MAQNHTKSLKPSVIAADRDSLSAVKAITDYAPPNSDYNVQSLLAAQAEMDAKLAALAQAEAAFKAARDDAVASTHRFHNKVVGMRDSVGAQYGKDSNHFQSVGRKKTTEYKKPTRRATKLTKTQQ
jgi:Tfp pilus assembly protein PilW